MTNGVSKEHRPRIMLALDGGGLLGLITLGILREVERQLRTIAGDQTLRLGTVFDYIGGTSTGAIIAAGLALGKPVCDLQELYMKRGRDIFTREWLHRRAASGFSHRYSAGPIGRILRDECGTESILAMQESGKLSQERHLMIVARNKSTNSCWPMTTFPGAYYNNAARDDCNRRIPLWQLVRASTAAPFFFPPECIRLDPNDPMKQFFFEDGGLTAHNNPALKLFQQATLPEYGLGWESGERNLIIISVGTGRNERRRTDIPTKGDHLFGIAQKTPASLMSGISAENDLSCRLVGRCVHGYKIDSEVGHMIPDVPLETDTGKAFLYARYDADLSDAGLAKKGLTATDKQLQMDNKASLALFDRIGTAFAQEVRLIDQFGPTLYRALDLPGA